ncbi:MAG: hypothetical protein IPM92_11945 [Saprospiraceae bacterium]|nr:hypothetical protein [Saprospiraceae bacterium]
MKKLILFSMLFYFSCKSSQRIEVAEPESIKHWLTIEKLPCFGHCQIYQLSIYRNGLAILEGKDHMDKKGVYFTEINNSRMEKLMRLEKYIKWQSIKSEYIVNIADLPMTKLKYYDKFGALVKSIEANANLPEELNSFVKEASGIIEKEKWTQIQKKNEMNNPEIIFDELIVDMDSTININDLEVSFQNYDLKTINRISPLMNLWLVKFNPDKIGKYEILTTLRKKQGIRHVSFNRRVLPRE